MSAIVLRHAAADWQTLPPITRRTPNAILRQRIILLLRLLDTEHRRVREVASRWYDGPTGAVRAELHVIANELLAPTLGDLP